jgi:adhesin transport system outer membrane protein
MTNYGRFLYALTGALTLVLSAPAQAESLQEAVRVALANHPGMEIAAARKDAAHQQEAEEFSNYFPEISTNLAGGRMYGNNSTTRGLTVTRGEAYSWLWEGSASLTQPIFNGFSTVNRVDAAQARVNAAELTIADTKQALALRATQAYFNVMRAQDALEKTKSYQDTIKDYLSRINKMVDSGAADESEAAQARNIQALLDNNVAQMEGDVKLALADYAEAIGSLPTGRLVKTPLQKDLFMMSSTDAVEHAKTYHPLVLSARKQMEAEDKEVSADRGALLPTLAGELSYLERDQKEEIGGEVTDARALMRASWNISTGGAQIARIRKSKAERSEAMARIAQTQRQIERDIRRSYADYETAKKQKDLTDERVKITRELFHTYEKQFEASRVRLLQLMQAENQLFTTELEQINSEYRLLIAEYTTMASAGRLLDVLNLDGTAVLPLTANAVETKPSQTLQSEESVSIPSKDEALAPEMFADNLEQKLIEPAKGK